MHNVQEVQQKEREFATLVFVIGVKGQTVVVEDLKKQPSFTKIPGGKGELIEVKEGEKFVEKMESPETCGVRELREETGLSLKEKDLIFVDKIIKANHDLYLFKTKPVKDFGMVKEKGDEGELVTVSYVDKVAKMDFFPPHKNLLIKNNLIDVE